MVIPTTAVVITIPLYFVQTLRAKVSSPCDTAINIVKLTRSFHICLDTQSVGMSIQGTPGCRGTHACHFVICRAFLGHLPARTHCWMRTPLPLEKVLTQLPNVTFRNQTFSPVHTQSSCLLFQCRNFGSQSCLPCVGVWLTSSADTGQHFSSCRCRRCRLSSCSRLRVCKTSAEFPTGAPANARPF